MTQHQATGRSGQRIGGSRAVSRWIQRRANSRTNARVRRKDGSIIQPRIAKYQSKSDREYPVVRLTRRQMETR